MHEPAAREDGRSTVGVQQSHLLAAAVMAPQTAGHEPQNRRVTADSFRALKDRLAKGKTATPPAPAQSEPQPQPQPQAIVVPASPDPLPTLPKAVEQEPVPAPQVIDVAPPQIAEPEPVAVAVAPVFEPPPPEPEAVAEPPVEVPEPTPFVAAPAQEPAFAELEPPEPIPGYDAPAVPETAEEPETVETAPAEPLPELRLEPAPQPVEAATDIVTVEPEPPVFAAPPVVAAEPEPPVFVAPPVVAAEPEPPVFVKPPVNTVEPPVETASPPSELSFNEDRAEVAPQPPEDMAAILSAVFGQGAASWKLPDAEPPSAPQPVQQVRRLAEEFAAAPAPSPEPVQVAQAIEQPANFAPPPVIDPKKELPPSLLRKRQADEADPFAQTQLVVPTTSPALPPIEIGEPDPQAGETARSLLDIMSASATVSQPQERALAADTLLRLIPRVPEKTLIALVERVAIMESPPPLLVTRLIRDPRHEVAGPLLEKASHIPDRDLIAVIAERDAVKLRLIARRRLVSPALVDALIGANDTSVLLTLIRNPGAAPSHEAFHALCEAAKAHPALQAPLITRQDTPVPTAFDLFWFLPPELRRFVLSRFLTDSENLNRILKIARTADSTETRSEEEATEAAQFPERKRVENLISILAQGHFDAAASEIAVLAQICEANALRIVHDPDGEPLTIALKVLGLSRAKFADGVVTLQQSANSTLRKDRNAAELQSIFDSMSFNKARVLLTYWDWLALKSGPYTQLAA
jgi:hypothetical protein